MVKQPCLIIPGTWAPAEDPGSDKPAYFHRGGSFVTFLEVQDYKVFYTGRRYWTGNLEGGPVERWVYRRWAQDAWHRDWTQGGENIEVTLRSLVDPGRMVVFVHSHGLQPLLYALARESCPAIGALCSIGSPDRSDMLAVAAAARGKILGPWIHLADGTWSDYWKILGTLGSGTIWDTIGAASGMSVGPALADRRERIDGVSHTGLVNSTRHYHHWLELKVLSELRRIHG